MHRRLRRRCSNNFLQKFLNIEEMKVIRKFVNKTFGIQIINHVRDIYFLLKMFMTNRRYQEPTEMSSNSGKKKDKEELRKYLSKC